MAIDPVVVVGRVGVGADAHVATDLGHTLPNSDSPGNADNIGDTDTSAASSSAGLWRVRAKRVRAAFLRLRERAYATPLGRLGVKLVVAVAGTLIIAVGVVLLPLPGPGWLIILGGLALLAMEFAWAKRLLRFTRGQLLRWTRLVKEGSWLVRIVSVGGLLLVVGGALLLSLRMLA